MGNKIKTSKTLQSPVLCKKDLIEKYHDILKKGGLTLEQLNSSSTQNIIFQSSSGVTGEPFLIPRTKQDIEDIVHRCFFNYYQKEYGKIPGRIALFGGISHTQAALKLKIQGVHIQSFSLEQIDLLDEFRPKMVSCYPSIIRELIEKSHIKLSTLKAIKLGGERIFQTDIKKIASRFPHVPVIEQLGSTEMPAIAMKLHKEGVFSKQYILEEGRFSFAFEKLDGWQNLIVKDNFPEQFFPIDGFYFTGDEVLLKDSMMLDIRRKGDIAYEFNDSIEQLLQSGCCNVQFDLNNKILYYSGNIKLSNTITVNKMEFKPIKKGQLDRLHPSNKLPLVINL